MNKIKYFALIAAVLGSATTFAAKDSTFKFQNSVRVGYDDNIYQKGIKVSNRELETITITKNTFHGEWNYTLSPKTTLNM